MADIHLETDRLVVRDATEDDLPALLEVFLSNPAYLSWTEGTAGEPGRYDLEMLQRDWALAAITPERRFLGAFTRQSDEAVGVADFMQESPTLRQPWVGLVMVHGDHQRRGFGREILARLLEHFRDDLGWSFVGAGVAERNEAGLAFARALGFERSGMGTRTGPGGEEAIVLFRRSL